MLGTVYQTRDLCRCPCERGQTDTIAPAWHFSGTPRGVRRVPSATLHIATGAVSDCSLVPSQGIYANNGIQPRQCPVQLTVPCQGDMTLHKCRRSCFVRRSRPVHCSKCATFVVCSAFTVCSQKPPTPGFGWVPFYLCTHCAAKIIFCKFWKSPDRGQKSVEKNFMLLLEKIDLSCTLFSFCH